MDNESNAFQELDGLAAESSLAIAAAGDTAAIEQQRITWLGKKSRLNELMKRIPQLPPQERGAFGKRINDVKRAIEEELANRRAQLAAKPAALAFDWTLPGVDIPQGRLHPITQTMREVLALFRTMGFEIAEGPEMELEYYNFDGLNIPADHPSRDSFDTFFSSVPSPDPEKGRLVLRSHTTPVQVRILENRKPPLRVVTAGRVFRRDALDPGHSFMFHQIDGFVVDEKTNFADLKGILQEFLRGLFGPETQARFRPHFFPFTEPSAEVDIASSLSKGEGDSSFARKRWVEIMGCGMVHPNVLRLAGHDPNKYQGFAFGMGIERIAMLRRGIPDIRLLFENDIRFLEQF